MLLAALLAALVCSGASELLHSRLVSHNLHYERNALSDIVYTVTLPQVGLGENLNANFQLPKFNPNLGTLAQVHLSSTSQVEFELVVNNTLGTQNCGFNSNSSTTITTSQTTYTPANW
jgi:hypothetical protein